MVISESRWTHGDAPQTGYVMVSVCSSDEARCVPPSRVAGTDNAPCACAVATCIARDRGVTKWNAEVPRIVTGIARDRAHDALSMLLNGSNTKSLRTLFWRVWPNRGMDLSRLSRNAIFMLVPGSPHNIHFGPRTVALFVRAAATEATLPRLLR